MATRSGKANTIQPGIGVASPRMVLFRDAGFASVWDWGDDAGNDGPTGTPIICDLDCVIGVTSEASFLADSALVVSGACAVATDTGIVTTRRTGVFPDQRMTIYEVTAFAENCDLQAITLNAKSMLFDEGLSVSNALIKGFDAEAEITGLLAKQFDLSLQPYALRTVYGDLLISVPNPTLLAADISVAVSEVVSTDGDQWIAVSGSIERLGDCLQSVWGVIERQMDFRLILGERISLESDQALRVSSISVTNCDVATQVACVTAFTADVEIRTSGRLVPDADLMQRVYAVVMAESHPIQV